MTLVTSEHPKMVSVVPYCGIVGKPRALAHTHLCVDQYLSVITFRRDVLATSGILSSLSLLYTLGIT